MPDVANNPTRQQLDELDSLLQKMLGVPTGASVDAAPTVRKSEPVVETKPDFPKYTSEPAAAASAPATGGWAIDLNPRGSSSVLGERSPLRGGSSPVVDLPRPDVVPPSTVALQVKPLAVPASAPSPRRSEPVPLLLQPFAAVTACFDNIVGVFGPLGRLASSSFGRTMMGLSGLALLFGSSAWFAMIWFGWSP